ncbi:MAG: hypothetical protein Q7V58_11685 [Actinomycetota bacterium]|nr:hypothetical protein [Actinomycetota bacterium]
MLLLEHIVAHPVINAAGAEATLGDGTSVTVDSSDAIRLGRCARFHR